MFVHILQHTSVCRSRATSHAASRKKLDIRASRGHVVAIRGVVLAVGELAAYVTTSSVSLSRRTISV